MSLETATERKRKRIVEYEISGFPIAQKAVIFGNTVEALVKRDIKPVKFRQYIKGETNLAITENYPGETTLKLTFLELEQDTAHAIMDKVKNTVRLHEETHGDNLTIDEEILRGKPLPQSINMGGKPLHVGL